MGDPTQGEPPVQPTPTPPEAEPVDPSIEALFQEPESEPQPAPPSDPRLEALERELSTMREAQAELRAENAILSGRLSERPAPIPLPQMPSMPEEPELDREVVLKSLRDRPLETIQDIVERAVKKTRQEVLQEVDRKTSSASGMALDEQKTVSDYPELKTDPDFRNRTMELYRLRQQEQGRYVPGDLYMCASTAYTERGRAQAARKPPEQKEDTSVGSVRERLRVAGNPGLGSRSAPPEGGKSDMMREFSRFSTEEQSGVEKACKKWGISLETYMKRYMQAKKGNPRYGTGG